MEYNVWFSVYVFFHFILFFCWLMVFTSEILIWIRTTNGTELLKKKEYEFLNQTLQKKNQTKSSIVQKAYRTKTMGKSSAILLKIIIYMSDDNYRLKGMTWWTYNLFNALSLSYMLIPNRFTFIASFLCECVCVCACEFGNRKNSCLLITLKVLNWCPGNSTIHIHLNVLNHDFDL